MALRDRGCKEPPLCPKTSSEERLDLRTVSSHKNQLREICTGFFLRGIMSEIDYEKLAEIELQKDEAEDTQSGQDKTFTPPPHEDPQLDINHPYYDVARHGIIQLAVNEWNQVWMLSGFTFKREKGDDNSGRKVITFSCCRMPPSHQLNHTRLLEYLKYTLEQYVENDYTVVYFHYGLKSLNKPSLKWLQTAYKEFDRKYKKNLKALYVVHPTNFIKILWNIFKPLISHKFGKKVTYLNYLSDLREHLKYDQLNIPQEVIRIKDKNSGELIPPVMKETVSYLKRNGLQVEGLFRRSASIQTIKDVQKLYNQGKPVNFDDYHDIHVPAVILKTFLRELPQPLLTFECYDPIVGITSVESCLRVTRCKQIIQGLPEHNYIVLKYLICFLHMVSQESIYNRMTASSLACVFGLNLIWPSKGAASLSALVPLNLFTELLIDFYMNIFNSRTVPGEILP
ncbi:rho GTPase-activating protein 8 isoform X3 [Centrocercus urophasianus]|uniref:rho GTPase-activating protein 8 isoform X3 n=1 Tax=Centrocercus urophasianus TaxID=9002 RepID=UPI001C647239|nr:rho GTPase-activating protein 8 isoform X3 [Centrocercus urophasianus]